MHQEFRARPRVRWVALAALICVAPALAETRESPAIPPKVPAETFKDVPAPWRDYLIRARAAEQISSPLERCLAFPDIPGNRWPAGHAAAHCRQHFAYPLPTVAEIAGLLDGGRVADLDSRMAASLQRHFDAREPSEDIHDIFNYHLLAPGLETDRVTAKWLQLAPDSPCAQLARASFLHRSAWDARGEKLASETPRENMRRMSEFAAQAIPYYEEAIALEPRLMPAYTGLVDLGMLDSRSDLERDAFERGRKADPACVEMANVRMRALSPRWGGDYEQMLAYAAELSRYVTDRPHLAMHLEKPYADRGDRLLADKKYNREAREVFDIALATGSDEDALQDAADLALNPDDIAANRWQALAYLLQETRFRPTSLWGNQQIAWQLVVVEPEWSLGYALRVIDMEPGGAFGHYVAGAASYNAGLYEQADREYAIAIEDAGERQTALREVSNMWLFVASKGDSEALRKATGYVARLLREYPDDGRGWLLDLRRQSLSGAPFDIGAVRKVLEKVDRSDPWQAERAEGIDRMLREVESRRSTSKAR